MCIFVILCVEETYYFICVVGGGYRISNFLMAKEVNKEVKKRLQHQCPTIKYYENTKNALNRKLTKKIPQRSCVSSRK
jgi:tRNA U54 and U55 pseudouridine synthase Pus10